MRPFRTDMLCRFLPVIAISCLPSSVLACASCGCTLSSDWESQGFTTRPGLKLDVRYDYLDQHQLRHDTGTISAVDASRMTTSEGDPQEVERYTRNHYVTLGLDYAFDPVWGVNVQVPYVDRMHATLGLDSNGSDPAVGAYDSSTSGLGDIRVIGRYQGFSPQHNLGLMVGVKLPTGSHTQTGVSTDPSTPGEATPIDRGLQPGSGTTDAIVGAYYVDSLNKNWDYFAQAVLQTALDSRDDYKPGTGYNVNLGMRYMAYARAIPQLQLNARHVEHDTGANADRTSTGGTLVYLSPGLVVPVGKQTAIYGFLQVPLYQDVRGVQLVPRYTASIGARFAF